MAGDTATFGVSEARWSLYPAGGSAVRLRRQIPYTIAAEILLTGKHLTAQETKDIGLIGHVVPAGEALAKAREIAEVINFNGPLAVEAILRTLRETETLSEEEAFAHEMTYGMAVMGSEDAKEGPRAFKEKRSRTSSGSSRRSRPRAESRQPRGGPGDAGHARATDRRARRAGLHARDPFRHYARLRAEAPVAWNDTVGFWALSRHAEVHEVSCDPQRFSSKGGILTMEIGIEYPTPPTMMHTDPPDHTAYRKLVQPGFKPSLMTRAGAGGPRAPAGPVRPGDGRRAGRLRRRRVGAVPAAHHRRPARPARRRLGAVLLLVRGHDPRRPGPDPGGAGRRSRPTCGPTSSAVIAERRVEPREDLISVLAAEDLNDDELYMFLNQLLVAGNETTRNTISGGLWALAERPDQWQRLVDDRSLIAVRGRGDPALDHRGHLLHAHAPPRTRPWAAQAIAAGRPGAHALQPRPTGTRPSSGPPPTSSTSGRNPNHHLAFGFGAHYCIGAALARLEVRLVLEELLARFRTMEPAGEVAYSPSDIIAGVTSAPLRFAV